MINIKKLNKHYGKRRIKVFDDKTYLGQISTWMNWIWLEKNYSKSVVKTDDEIYKILRKIAMENLWWLLHTDNLDEDVSESEAWFEKCNKWNSGKMYGEYGNVDSLFFEDEYDIALKSIHNK